MMIKRYDIEHHAFYAFKQQGGVFVHGEDLKILERKTEPLRELEQENKQLKELLAVIHRTRL